MVVNTSRRFPWTATSFFCCFLLLRLLRSQLYFWGSPFLVRILRMWLFFNPTIEIVTFRLPGFLLPACYAFPFVSLYALLGYLAGWLLYPDCCQHKQPTVPLTTGSLPGMAKCLQHLMPQQQAKSTSGTDLLRLFHAQPHWGRSGKLNLLSHSITVPTLSQPVFAMTSKHKAPGRATTKMLSFFSLLWFSCGLKIGSPMREADTFTAKPWRWWQEKALCLTDNHTVIVLEADNVTDQSSSLYM